MDHSADEFETFSVVASPPLLVSVVVWSARLSAVICFFCLIGARVGSALRAPALGWTVGSVVGLMALPFVHLVVPVSSQLVMQLRTDISYPGARETAVVGPDGVRRRGFILPRSRLAAWLPSGGVLPWMLVVSLVPYTTGWASLVWLTLAFSPLNHPGLLYPRGAALAMLYTLIANVVCALLLFILSLFWKSSVATHR